MIKQIYGFNSRLMNNGDCISYTILKVIYLDTIGHLAVECPGCTCVSAYAS